MNSEFIPQITNQWAALAAITFFAFSSLSITKDKHKQYLIMVLGAVLGIGIMWFHSNQEKKAVDFKSQAETAIFNEKIKNVQEQLSLCVTEKDTSKKLLECKVREFQQSKIDKVRIDNLLSDYKTKNKILTQKLKEYEEGYNYTYHEGYCVTVNTDTHKFGYKDQRNKLVIPHKYLSACSFHNGRAGVKDQSNKWGYIDYSGTPVIEFQFDNIFGFEKDGTAIVYKNGKKLKIDKNGKIIKDYSATVLIASR